MNPYEILGVSSNASLNEIKSAYRALVKRHHPDTGGDEKMILSLNAAWEVLKDSESREAFDINEKINNSFIKKSKNRTLIRYFKKYDKARLELQHAGAMLTRAFNMEKR